MDPVPSDNAIYEEVKVEPTIPFDMDENKSYGQVSNVASKVEIGGRKCKKGQLFIILILFALLLAIVGACVAFSLEIIKLKSDITSLNGQIAFSFQQLQSKIDTQLEQLKFNESIGHENMVALQFNSSNEMLYQQLSQQNELLNTLYQQLSQQNESFNTQLSQQNESFNTQLSQQNEILTQQYATQLIHTALLGNFPFYPVVTCAALPPSSPSGYYWVRASNGSAVRVYCDMTTSCGDGGWMRVASLDFHLMSQWPSRAC